MLDSAEKILRPEVDLTPVLWAGFVLLSINALAFIYSTAATYVHADVWRHLDEILIPFLRGEANWTILWESHHPAPVLHLIQLANLKFFDLRLDYDAYLGFFFQLITTLLLLSSVIESTDQSGRRLGPTPELCASAFNDCYRVVD